MQEPPKAHWTTVMYYQEKKTHGSTENILEIQEMDFIIAFVEVDLTDRESNYNVKCMEYSLRPAYLEKYFKNVFTAASRSICKVAWIELCSFKNPVKYCSVEIFKFLSGVLDISWLDLLISL